MAGRAQDTESTRERDGILVASPGEAEGRSRCESRGTGNDDLSVHVLEIKSFLRCDAGIGRIKSSASRVRGINTREQTVTARSPHRRTCRYVHPMYADTRAHDNHPRVSSPAHAKRRAGDQMEVWFEGLSGLRVEIVESAPCLGTKAGSGVLRRWDRIPRSISSTKYPRWGMQTHSTYRYINLAAS